MSSSANGPAKVMFSPEEHPYVAPGPDDSRSPCPLINMLANHGYLPRDGRNVSAAQLTQAIAAATNISESIAATLAKQATQALGKKRSQSAAGQCPVAGNTAGTATPTTEGAAGTPAEGVAADAAAAAPTGAAAAAVPTVATPPAAKEGPEEKVLEMLAVLNKHGVIEHDASLTRRDYDPNAPVKDANLPIDPDRIALTLSYAKTRCPMAALVAKTAAAAKTTTSAAATAGAAPADTTAPGTAAGTAGTTAADGKDSAEGNTKDNEGEGIKDSECKDKDDADMYMSLQDFAKLRNALYADSKANNPNFTWSGMPAFAAYAEASFLLLAFGDGDKVRRDVLESVLLHERFPEGYEPPAAKVGFPRLLWTVSKLKYACGL